MNIRLYNLFLYGMGLSLLWIFVFVMLHIGFLVALGVLGFLVCGTLAWLESKGLRTPRLTLLFGIVVGVYLMAASIIHYGELYPFGGGQGDQPYYHNAALFISNDLKEGTFTWEKTFYHLVNNDASKHTYPLFIGVLYAATMQDQFIGKMVNVWIASLSILLVYFIARELGAKERWSVVAAVFAMLYPSYLYFNSLLVRESIVAALVLAGVLSLLKITKEFSWKSYGIFFLIGILLVHFRFYIGLVLLIAFALSWILFSRTEFKTRMAHAVILIPLLGLIPQAFGHGYFGTLDIYYYFHPDQIVHYRSYSDSAILRKKAVTGAVLKPQTAPGYKIPVETERKSHSLPWFKEGEPGSALVQFANPTKHPLLFMKDYAFSIANVAFGPTPLHLRYVRQLIVLAETVPWLGVVFLVGRGIATSRKRLGDIIPVILVTAGIITLIALFLNTYGTYMRVRIPAFLLLIALSALGLQSFGKQNRAKQIP